jgi:PAS domain S-box-containing protein
MKRVAVQEVVPVHAGALQHLPFAAALIDERGYIQHATRKWEAYFQQYPGEWTGQPVTACLPADPEMLLQALREAVAGGPPCEGACQARLRDGSQVQIGWKAVAWTEAPLADGQKSFLIWVDHARTVSEPQAPAQLLSRVPQLGVLSLDRAGRILAMNPGLQELLGYAPEDLAGLPLTVLWASSQFDVPGPDLAAVAQSRMIEMRAVHTDHTQRTLTARDGRQFRMHVYGRLLPPDDPSGAYAVEVLMPVPAAAAHESDRLYSLGLYHSILRNFPNGAVVVFDHDLRYFVAEGQGLAATGLNRERMLGKTIFEVFPPQVSVQIERSYRACLAGQPQIQEVEYQGRMFRTYLHPLHDPAGACMAGMVITQDITALRDAEKALRRSEHLYRTMAANLPDASVVLFDRDFRYLLAEGRLLRERGLSREAMEGKTIQEVYEPEVAAQLVKVYGRALNGEQFVRELTWNDRVFRLVAIPVQDESGAVQAGMVYTLDVTELKHGQLQLQRANMELEHRIQQRTSELLRANEEIKNFAYIVSHDLRIPLVNIKGFTRELEISLRELGQHLEQVMPVLPPGQQAGLSTLIHDELPESLQFISSGAAQMDRLIGAVLRLSRMGYREMDFKPIALKPFVEDVLRAIQHHLIEHGAQVEVEDLPQVHADPTALEQIFSNLISNAVQYRHPDRPPRIRITGEQHEQAVVIHIQDNGRGIAARNIPRIFHIFTRVGAATTEGEGMGLTFVKTLVQRHGGQIACQSELGAGSTFTFSLARHPEPPAR